MIYAVGKFSQKDIMTVGKLIVEDVISRETSDISLKEYFREAIKDGGENY